MNLCHTNVCHGNHYKQFLYIDRINYLPFNCAEKTLLQYKYKIHIKLCYHSNYDLTCIGIVFMNSNFMSPQTS